MRFAEAGAGLDGGALQRADHARPPPRATRSTRRSPARLPAASVTVDLLGWCFRHEPSMPTPAGCRPSGSVNSSTSAAPTGALAHRDTVGRAGAWRSADRLRLDVPLTEVANDPFFGRTGRLLANEQRESAAKIELVAPLGSTVKHTRHRLVEPGRRPLRPYVLHRTSRAARSAHSACVGFGLDRMTLALARAHGTDIRGSWPRAVRSELAL